MTPAIAATITGVPPFSAGTPPRPPARIRFGYFVLLAVASLPCLCVIGFASYFNLGSSARALRGAVMDAVPGHWHQRCEVNAGWTTCTLARVASSFFHLPPEARAALGALREGEVGVYQAEGRLAAADYPAAFKAADKAMRRRGLERIVGVSQTDQFVAVYAPRRMRSASDASFCVVVLNEENLVVVSASADLTSLIDLAQKQIHEHHSSLGDLARF